MNINVLFDVPALVAQGLMNGSLERVGGVVRDSSSKQVVMWLQEGGSEVSKALANPPVAGGANALAAANPLLATANLGFSVAGFALVLQQLNRISDQIRAVEAKLDRVSHKLDDQALAQLKAGINACQNAVELNDPTLQIQMAGQALTTLHAARQFFNQQVVRSAGKAEASSAEYVALAFVALAAEVQTYLQLDEGEKAARTLAQGLDELRPGLTQLMNAVLDCTCHYLKPEFAGEVNLDLMLWLQEFLASPLQCVVRRAFCLQLHHEIQWKSGSTANVPLLQYGHRQPPSWYESTMSDAPQLGHAAIGARESTLNSAPQLRQWCGESLPMHRSSRS